MLPDNLPLDVAPDPASAAPHVQPGPLDALLQSALEQSTEPAVKRWLSALLRGERAEFSPPSHPNPTVESNPLSDDVDTA